MKTPLTYGFLMALAGALLTLTLFFAGFHDSPGKMQSAQWIGGVAGVAITVAGLSFAMRARRAERAEEGGWSYGSAFGTGVLTGIFATLFGVIFAYFYFGYINPTMSDVILQLQLEKLEAARTPAAQMDRIEPMLRKWVSPGMLTVSQAISGLIISVVLSLIVAIFHRKSATVLPVDAPPTLA